MMNHIIVWLLVDSSMMPAVREVHDYAETAAASFCIGCKDPLQWGSGRLFFDGFSGYFEF
ncbi:hypothetical protein JW948_13840 [bacterium]|nr:hypothetical protein [bacterium]